MPASSGVVIRHPLSGIEHAKQTSFTVTNSLEAGAVGDRHIYFGRHSGSKFKA
jgi:hypothetical protein